MSVTIHKTNIRFTKEEDRKLRSLVRKYGQWDWSTVASYMENRNPRQCKDRWELYLSPSVNKSQWTKEEEDLLVRLADSMNQKWVEIAKKFDRRTSSQIRNKYRTIMRRKSRKSLQIEGKNIENKDKIEKATPKSVETQLELIDPFKNLEVEDFSFLFDSFETF